MKRYFAILGVFCALLFHSGAVISFERISTDQNIPILLAQIPPELQNLPYAIYPGDPDYNNARFNFNKRFNVFPKAIFVPTTHEEVTFVLSVLKKHRLEFAVRGGRHCTEPGSLSPDYIIDLSNFSQIIPDVANQQVYIGAGAQLANVIHTLGELNYAIPTGTCPTVGVTGLTLGGGIGYLCRTYGLTCDSVKNITLVNANAEIIEVNKDSYPDLFWALLGGGNGSYGIVLGITFKMFYIPVVSYYELLWQWDPDLAYDIFNAWQHWVKTLPTDISSVLSFRYLNGEVVIRVEGLKISAEPFTEWEKAFRKFNPEVDIFTGSYLDSSKFWSSEPKMPFNKIRSKILMEPLSQKVIKQTICFMDGIEHRKPPIRVNFLFEAFGGKVRDNRTSFFPRDAFGWWNQTYYWDLQEQGPAVIGLGKRFYDKTSPEVSPYSYANIVDYELGNCYMKAYYGDHVDCLIKIKRKYDPENLFHWKQSIPLKKPKCKD